MRFDFITSEAPLRFTIPEPLVTPLTVLAILLAAAALIWRIEDGRLRSAALLALTARERYALSHSAAERSRAAHQRFEQLRSADAAMRRNRYSGRYAAWRIVAVVNRLPRETTLTSLSGDATTVMLEGRARSVGVVARALLQAGTAIPNSRATLDWVRSDAHSGTVRFAFRVATSK